MIAFLSGKLLEKTANTVIVDVGGVGYEVGIPLSTFYELGEVGSDISLRIYTNVREDAIQLFGFKTARERDLYLKLISVQGVGAKSGITMLSGMNADEIISHDRLLITRALRSTLFEMRYADTLWAAVIAADMAAFNDLVSIDELWTYALAHAGMTGIPQARDATQLALERCSHGRRHVLRTRPGQRRRHVDGRKVHLRQRGDRQQSKCDYAG